MTSFIFGGIYCNYTGSFLILFSEVKPIFLFLFIFFSLFFNRFHSSGLLRFFNYQEGAPLEVFQTILLPWALL